MPEVIQQDNVQGEKNSLLASRQPDAATANTRGAGLQESDHALHRTHV